jgi:hypothetical protein
MSLIKVNQLSTLDGAAEAEVSANTGLKIPSTASLKVEGDLLDSGGAPGAAGQYLISNGTNVIWSNLPQDLDTNANVTFNNVTVEGDITITGNANFNLSAFTTDDLTEGSNQYYTDLKARQAISAVISGSGDGSIVYNSGSGVITYVGPEPSDYRAAFGAIKFDDGVNTFLGDLTFDSNNGNYIYVGPTVADIRSQFTAESNPGAPTAFGGLGFDENTGTISYVGVTVEEIRNSFNADTPSGFNPNGLTYDATTGTYYIDPGAIDPALIYAGINTSPTSTTGDINDSIQNLHVNNATFQQVSVSQVVVAAGGLGDVSAAGHTFIAGDRVKLVDTEDAHLDGIYEVLTSDSSGPGDPGTTFQVQTTNVAAGTYSPTAALTRRVSVFTGDLVVDGSINVNGSKIGLSDLFVGTSLIRLNSDLPDDQNPAFDGTDDAIIEVNRGAQPDTALRWNELARRWQFSNDGINYNNILLPSETDFGGAEEFGASGDPNRYNVINVTDNVVGSNTFKVLEVPDITKFKQNHRVKVFGLSKTQFLESDNPKPVEGDILVQPPAFESAGFGTAEKNYYAYAIAQIDLNTGDISAATVQGTGPVLNRNVDDLNEANYNIIQVTRDGGGDKGILIYRGIFADDLTGNSAQTAITNFASNSTSFKLIAVVGPKYFENTTTYVYNDYGSYDVTVNSERDGDGSFGPNEVHVPHTAPTLPKQGWITAGIRPNGIDEGTSTIEIDVPNLYQDGNLNNIYLYHDDTIPLQNAINDAKDSGRNFLVIPGGTYLVTQLEIPDKFTLRGLADATVLHRQYWSTEYITGNDYLNGNNPVPERNGIRSSMIVSEKYDGTLSSPVGMIDVFLGDIILDGSVKYQILNAASSFNVDANDTVVNGVNSKFFRLSNVKIRKSAGPALFAAGAENLTIDSCTFFDGADVERFQTPVLIADEGDTTIVTGCVFRDFPGALDFTTTNVLAVNACTIRNCGSGLRIYGSSKTDVLNNLILGPADEYIPVPDFYDSDFNSVNFPITIGTDNKMPVLQYVLSGAKYDFRANNTIRRVELFRASRDPGTGEEVVDLSAPITNGGLDWFQVVDDVPEGLQPTGTQVDPALGQTKFAISAGASSTLNDTYPTSFDNYNIYRAVGIDYVNIGDDLNPNLGTGTLDGSTYVVNCDELAYNSVIVDYYIKLVAHSYAPEPAPNFGTRIWRVVGKTDLGAGNYQLRLESWEENGSGDIKSSVEALSALTGVGTEPTTGGGYFQIRNKFVIARGILTVSP